jgi:transcriptional regulatory protein RtcR
LTGGRRKYSAADRGEKRWEEIDLFGCIQLNGVVKICRESRNLSDAGRKLFDTSRDRKTTANDADRLRKYLTRFGLDWQKITDRNDRAGKVYSE